MAWSLNTIFAAAALVLGLLVLLNVVGTTAGLALAVIALALAHLLPGRGLRIGR